MAEDRTMVWQAVSPLFTTETAASTRSLAVFLRTHRSEILQDWERAARAISSSRGLGRPALLDDIPNLLDCIANLAESEKKGCSACDGPAQAHAAARLSDGYDLDEVVAEYALLRDCVARAWDRATGGGVDGLRALHGAIDQAIGTAVDRFVAVRDTTLRALDRIATAGLESRDLEDLLGRLLRMFREMTAAVDTAAILLREGDRLYLRAASGLEDEAAQGFSLRIGEGFAGTIAAERKPMQLACAATDPLVVSPIFKQKGVRALYGVPLLDGDDVIGVAHIGSLGAAEFSQQDKALFSALAARATAAIHQHVLRDRAERAVRARDRAMAIVSHDLRNLLSVNEMATTLLMRSPCPEGDGEARQKLLARIARANEGMRRIIGDLLDLGSIDAGALSMDVKEHEARALVSDAASTFRDMAVEKSIRLTTDAAEATAVRCDRGRVMQVFSNLVGNALKFTAAGGHVELSARREGERVIFSVRDDGPGIAEDDLTSIFEPYRQARGDAARQKEGVGLGLAIAQGIVEAHGGKIWVVSEVGKGSTFLFSLPTAATPARP
ncbi:ATP-binding protein [Polyangium aurulentum]|uniref:ATP-binding protein n=1 Tax=Polyangium aurulentum TaxID=2567896 RepID=UPI00200F07A3|nr:ATP-binding protein [Polyangium aurulentum]UQA59096.1 GAF domain-containing protein [Polyangium aurulentum]